MLHRPVQKHSTGLCAHLQRSISELPIDVCILAGRKELGLDVNSVKPWQAVLIGAVGIVALGRPVTGSKRYPDFTLTLPGMRGKKGLAQVPTLAHAAPQVVHGHTILACERCWIAASVPVHTSLLSRFAFVSGVQVTAVHL